MGGDLQSDDGGGSFRRSRHRRDPDDQEKLVTSNETRGSRRRRDRSTPKSEDTPKEKQQATNRDVSFQDEKESRKARKIAKEAREQELADLTSSATVLQASQQYEMERGELQRAGTMSSFRSIAQDIRMQAAGGEGALVDAGNESGSGGQSFMLQQQKEDSNWKIVVTGILLLVAAIFGGISIVMFLDDDWSEARWGRGFAHRWMGWVALVLGSIPAAYWSVRGIWTKILPHLVTESLWYWLTGLQPSVGAFLWSIANWVILPFVMPSVVEGNDGTSSTNCNTTTTDLGWPQASTAEGTFVRWVEIVVICIIVISVLRVVKVLFSKYLVTQIHHGAFWNSIRDALSLERLLVIFGVGTEKNADGEIEDDFDFDERQNAASFWLAVDRVLSRPRLNVRDDGGLLAYQIKSAVPTFNELEAMERLLSHDAEAAAMKIWKKCGAELPYDPETETLDAVSDRVHSDKVILTFRKFATALEKPRRRRMLPKSSAAAARLVYQWWCTLDMNAHAGPFLAKASPSPPSSTNVSPRNSANPDKRKSAAPSEQFLHLQSQSVIEHGITFMEMVNILKVIFGKRESLYNTLHDREDISQLLGKTVDVLFWVIITVIVPLIIGVNITALLLPLGTFVIGLGFVFGNSFKEAWESVLFLFATKPFNIGDRITIGIAGQYPSMFVRKIGLLETELQASDGRMILMNTHNLRKEVIIQHSRSVYYACSITMLAAIDTPSEKLELMALRIKQWAIEDREKRGTPWLPSNYLFYVSDANQQTGTVTLNVWMELRGITWNKPVHFLPLKHDLWSAWLDIARELDISYHQPTQPIVLSDSATDALGKMAIFSDRQARSKKQIPPEMDEQSSTFSSILSSESDVE